ncbi:DUF997 family protein [Verrucomicrobiales bacterium BCK34]|nr:DUF997 family protein [Verrucomicrobiales bacterium BCK34]
MSDDVQAGDLGISFRQSRKELYFMVASWVVFAGWTISYVGLKGGAKEGEALRLVWGMPEWVVYGILIPWIFGLGLTVWFALRFMKDTDLDPAAYEVTKGEEGK